MGELEIAEVEPQTLLPGLTKSFLETQTDDWIVRLYGFLHGQQALLRRMTNVPLIRLEDGSHVTPRRDTQPQAFLPGERVTGFPTVRRSVCQTEAALAFLKGLGLTEPDTVDDVIANVIPKYQQSGVQVKLTQYQADIERMVAAFSTDSTAQRIKLVAALRSSKFVFATDCANGNRHLYQPTEVYQATQRLKDLFRGVPSVMIVDDSFDCLRGEDIRDLLEACGAALYLQPVETESAFTWQEKVEMRRKAGREDISYEVGVQDFALRGLETLLDMFAQLTSEEAQARSRLLWEALCDVQDRRGTSVFSGIYHWFYVSPRRTTFDASFVRLLNEGAWVPDVKGDLQPPRLVVFEDIDPRLEANPFLLTKIHYKPPAIAQLAKEAGFEPGMLDLLKKYGLTSEAQMREILNVTDCPPETDGQSRHDELTPEEATRKLLESLPEPTPPAPSPPENPVVPTINGGNGAPHRGGPNSHPEGHGGIGGNGGRPRENGHPISNPAGGSRKFVSYVSVDPNDDGPDPDGLNHQERMALEEEGIKLIQSLEPELQCTPKNNPGFDLTQQGSDGHPVKWVEVKAMKGTFYDRPVGLSSKQFGCAQQHGEAYWLYIVQLAGSPENARIVRIQDPAGKARTFTFDHGWTAVAEITEPAESLRQE
jgi:hypothetical protein